MSTPPIQRLPPLLQRSQACLAKPLDQAMAWEPNGGKRTRLLEPSQAAPLRKRVPALQGAEQHTAPPVGPAHLLWASSPMDGGGTRLLRATLWTQSTSLEQSVACLEHHR